MSSLLLDENKIDKLVSSYQDTEQLINEGSDELKIHIRTFSDEKEKGSLQEHEINKQLQPQNLIFD